MTTLAEAPGPHWSRRFFEFEPEDLAHLGISLADEQAHLFEQYVDGEEEGYAMTFAMMSDYQRGQTPLIAWDAEADEPTLIIWPEVIKLGGGWEQVPACGSRAAPLRFPSLVGAAIECTPWWTPDEAEVDAHRIWNLWPIDLAQAKEIGEISSSWLESDENIASINDYMAVNYGDWDTCDLAQARGVDIDDHDHSKEKVGSSDAYLEQCLTGEEEFFAFQSEICVEVPDPEDPKEPYLFMRSFPGPRLDGDLLIGWQRLISVSQEWALRLPTLVPPWERDELVRSERWYSPWLWLC